MKIVLAALNARFSHSNPALHSIYYYAKEQLPPALFANLEIVIKAFNINQITEEVAAALYAEKADIYAFSVYIWNASFRDRLLPALAGRLPEALFVCGGPEVEYDYEAEYQRQPLWSYVCTGEGEAEYLRIFRSLAEGEEAGALLSRLRASQKRGEGLSRDASLINDIPFFYPEIIDKMAHRIIYYESSRGCPFNCSYCVSCLESAPVFRDLDKVFRELSWFIENDIRLVKFLDRSFNFPPERARKIWRFLIDACRDIPESQRPCFHFELEASLLDEASLELLKEAPKGLFQFEIGIQSIHEATLRRVRRAPMSAQDFERLRQLIAAGRQHIHVDLIAGLPGESAEEYAASYNYCWTLWADMLQAGHLKLLRGTPLKAYALAHGYQFNPYPPYEVYRSDAMSADEILEADRVSDMTDRYYNQGLLPGLLPELPKLLKLEPYALMSLLGEDFYRQRGESLRAISKNEHYVFMQRFLERTLTGAPLKKALDLLRLDYETVSKPGSLSWPKIVQKYAL